MVRLLFIILLGTVGVLWAQDSFHVKEHDTSVELKTPYGDKEITGVSPGQGWNSYKIVIPLKDLQPPPTPTPAVPTSLLPPTATPTPTKDEKSVDSDKDRDVDSDDDTEDEDEEGITPPVAETPKPPEVPPVVPPKPPEYDDSDEMVLEANWLYNHRRFFEASTIVQRLLQKKPTLVRAWIMKGSLLYVQGEKDLARKAWEHVKEIEPTNPEVGHLLERYR